MTKNIKQNDGNLLISKLTESGISLESITNAANAEEFLTKKSPSKKSDALNPNHFNDYQNFFFELCTKKQPQGHIIAGDFIYIYIYIYIYIF